jgi:hypothetical protein
MTIALFLFPYAAVVLLVLIASIVFLFHLLRFGIASFSLFAVLLIYLLVTGTLLTTSFRSLSSLDWSQPLEFGRSRNVEPFFLDR